MSAYPSFEICRSPVASCTQTALSLPPTEVLSKGNFTTIDYPGANATIAFGNDELGEIVGLYFDADGVGHGFLLSNGTFTSIDPPASVFTIPFYVDPYGRVLGLYADVDGVTHGFLLTKSKE